MLIDHNYDKEFVELIDYLKSKYGKEIFEIEGIGKQLDITEFSRQFFSSKVTADVSIDENANVSTNCVISYRSEVSKPILKLNGLFIIWKMLRKTYSTGIANDILEMQISGDIYIHDSFLVITSYCFNFSCLDIIFNGLPFINNINSFPPKHLFAFKSQLEQFIAVACNSILGATGIADLLICMSYYVKSILDNKKDSHFTFSTEEDCWIYVRETIVSLIYTLNQRLRAQQAPFTNVSVYDKNFIKESFKTYIFPDGSTPDTEIVNRLQEIYLDAMNDELERTVFTYPVTTACFSVDENGNLLDEEFAEFIAEKDKKFGFINIYIGKSSTLSSCCFSSDTKVLCKSSNGVIYDTFENVSKMDHKNKKNFTIFHNGSWSNGNLVKLQPKKMFKITTSNKKEILVTEDHIHCTDNGDKKTTELTTNDFFGFNTRELNTFPEKDMKLTYEQGFLIGLYLGDGSKYKDKKTESYTTIFSMGPNDYDVILKIKKALKDWGIKNKLRTYELSNNVLFIQKNSKVLYNIINKWVYGNYSYEKELNMDCLLQSVDFRNGIIDGWYKSDGGNSNRIYSTSEKLIKQGECLLTSIGKNSIINVSDRTGKNNVIIKDKKYNRNYPLYCIRWYDNKNKISMGNVYKIINNTEFFKIISIEEISYKNDYVYCFQMKNQDEPYFTLPNGIITHNCRLKSDIENDYFNSIGGSSSKIGSLGVCSINLPRLAKKCKSDEEFFDELEIMVQVTGKINNCKRKIIQRKIEEGMHPLYTHDFINLKKQYSTTGIIGLYECLKYRGYDILTEDGINFSICMMDIINGVIKNLEHKYKNPHNCEQVPAESASPKLANKDNILGYNDDYKWYSNQFIPLDIETDLLNRIEIQGILDNKFSGGSIAHLNVDTQIEDNQKIVDLIKLCAKKKVQYFAINYQLNKCKNGHVTVGKSDICKVCGEKIDIRYSRVVGFLVPVKNMSRIRREEEYDTRKFLKGI